MKRMLQRAGGWWLAVAAAVGCDDSLLVGDEPAGSARWSDWARLGRAGQNAIVVQPDRDLQSDLHVVFLDNTGQQVDRVRVPCGETCTQIMVEVSGGSGRYQLEWEDGSSLAERRVCLGASDRVGVRVVDLELRQALEQALIPLSVESACAANVPAAPTQPADGLATQTLRCMPPADALCVLPLGAVLPSEVTVDVQGASIRYFAAGAALPAGRYRVSYVDGCLTAGDPSFGPGWAVHGSKNMLGVQSCYLISDTMVPLEFTPGSVGAWVGPDVAAGEGAYRTYDECIAANCGSAPVDIVFAGGRLGVARDGGTVLGAVDDLGGEAVGGRSPTFRLTSLDACL